LGTDALGRDALSGLIHGTKISLLVGIVAMGIATTIGLFLGSVAGFFGDHELKISRLQAVLLVPGLFFGYFYGFIVRGNIISASFHESIFSGFFHLLFSLFLFFIFPFLFVISVKWLKKGFFGTRISLPVDSIISRLMEIFHSMPKLLLIISFSAIIEERSLWLVMVIIGLTSWTEIARFTRAEMLRVREMEYITAARSMGFKPWRIIFKHALPNSMAPVFVTIAFGIASAILIESGLSFLNIGVPADTVTWGSMLNIGRTEPEAWWLIVFPGIAIFVTVTVFNLIGDGLQEALDPKLKK
jgi:peptide/nickel transport system permease protein